MGDDEAKAPGHLTAIGVVMDCHDPVALADFWMAAVGFTVRTGDGNPYVTLSEAPLRRPLNHLTLQRVAEPKTVKNRTHIDLFSRRPPDEVERLVALGATVTTPPDADQVAFGFGAYVCADPEGHEFCVVGRLGDALD